MKASELRIGNYATIDNPKAWPDVKGIPLKVSGTRSFKDEDFPSSTGDVKLKDGEYSQFDEFIQPIPLTEEWLLKFGFVKRSMHGYDRHFAYHHHKLRSPITAIYNTDFSMCLDNCARGVQYVHQLQNLYFTLTGEELTIKEGKECQHSAH